MILHGENGCWREEFISLPYDTDRVIREMHEADMYRHAPYWSRITEKILQEGGSPMELSWDGSWNCAERKPEAVTGLISRKSIGNRR